MQSTVEERNADLKEKRLRTIRSKFVILGKECQCCGFKVRLKKMWVINALTFTGQQSWYYCTRCAPTEEDVLYDVEEKENIWRKPPPKLTQQPLKKEDAYARTKEIIKDKRKQQKKSEKKKKNKKK